MCTHKGVLECFVCQNGIVGKLGAQINRVITIYLCAGCVTRVNNAMVYHEEPNSIIDIDSTPIPSDD